MKTRPEPGTIIRLTSAFLRSTGQSRRDDEGKWHWKVMACSCIGCTGPDPRLVCTDQEHDPEYRARMWGDLPEDRRPRYRHLAIGNVEVVGKAEPEPRAEIVWWTKVTPSIPYCGHESIGPRDLRTRVLCYRGEVFWRWCGYLWATGFAHGSELAEALGTPGLLPQYPTGNPDNCASADCLLEAAEEAGWIRRVSPGRQRAYARKVARGDMARAANAGDAAGVEAANTAFNAASGLFLGDVAEATPTPEQCFFGANGVFGEAVRKQRTPRLFGWEPVRDSALREWLGYGDGSTSIREEA